MKAIKIDALSTGALRALRLRAMEKNRTPEAELREILEEVLCPEGRLQIGSALAGLSKATGLSNRDIEALESARDANLPAPMWFG